MRRTAIGLALTIALALFPWQDAWGQVSIGAHASYMTKIGTGLAVETADGTMGVGGRFGVGIPVVGIKFLVTADMYFPDCGTDDCEFYAGTVNVLYGIPGAMVISPYFGAGVAVQNSNGQSLLLGNVSDWGVNLMAGFSFGGLSAFEPFVEAKYQLMNDFDDPFIISAGLAYSTW